MKKLVLTVAFCNCVLFAFCQKSPYKFGDVSLEEVKMSAYDQDSSAAAVVLVDYGNSAIKYSSSKDWFNLQFERTTRIKIFNKEGYEHANFEVPIYHSGSSKERLSGLKVVTYNLDNGKISETKIKSDAIFEEKYDQNTDFIKFTAPNIREGSVVEVTYTITSDFLHYFRDWDFQTTIPVVWSEYRAAIPEYFTYEKFMQGYVPLHINESETLTKTISITSKERSVGKVTQTTFSTDNINYQELNFRWVAKEVAAFRSEPFMTTYLDYISKINFELAYYKFPNEPIQQIIGTWAGLNKTFLENDYFGNAVNGSGFLKKIAEEVTTNANTPQEKVEDIFNFVLTNIEWDGTYRKFLTDDNFRAALDKKKGSSSHINLMLVSMLQKIGISAHPVILSTRNHGFVREDFAISSQFNYVIALVTLGEKSLLLDATDRLLPMGALPEHCLNGRGYIISKDNPGWISLEAPKSKITTTTELTLDTEGKFTGNLKIISDGYAARKARASFLSKGEEEYLKNFTLAKTLSITKSEFKNAKEIKETFQENHEFLVDAIEGAPGTVYLSPIIHLAEETNPFKLEKREYPVDFGSPYDKVYMLKLNIPDTYEFDEIPQSKVIALPGNGGRFIYNTQVIGNTLSITSMLSINKGIFNQEEYPNLREFFNIVVAKQAEQVVLKKKI
jgi:hypothetical protein